MSVPEEVYDGSRIWRCQQCFAKWSLGETLGKFGQNLQVLLGRLLGHQQHKQKIDRSAIRRIEGNGCGQAQECTGSLLEALDAAMRDRNALAQARGAKFLAGEKTVEYDGTRKPEMSFEKHAGLLEDTLLAAGIKVENDLGNRQEVGQWVHGGNEA